MFLHTVIGLGKQNPEKLGLERGLNLRCELLPQVGIAGRREVRQAES